MKINLIKNEKHDEERAYFASKNTHFKNITIAGKIDGESAFKECQNIEITRSKLALRYPCWNNQNTKVSNTKIAKTARAPFWYDQYLFIDNVHSQGVKAVREDKHVEILRSTFISDEFGWQCHDLKIEDSHIVGFYAFFRSKNVSLKNVVLDGKYSFQYIDGLTIDNCVLNTKDAFWHTKNAVIKNSTIIGEYLGWHSQNITFNNCRIVGTQPLCYAKNIKFVNCTFEKADLAFEYSEVNGIIKGTLISIKNPLSGRLMIDQIPEMIIDKNDKSHGHFSIENSK
ncbi:MAG: DUF3737 family protein [Erysipelotrichaceae bacterium]|nr:DUF3737 family protein [Erysipelotrichaceae bacterium]